MAFIFLDYELELSVGKNISNIEYNFLSISTFNFFGTFKK